MYEKPNSAAIHGSAYQMNRRMEGLDPPMDNRNDFYGQEQHPDDVVSSP